MAREVMLPQVFRNARMEKVLAHAQIADQLGMVLGPMLAALGKTTGLIVLLNNLSQPVAGLLVGLFAGRADTQSVILGLTLGMGLLGGVALALGAGRVGRA